MQEVVNLLVAKRDATGRWPLDYRLQGRMALDFGESVGMPSRWITLRALRVLKWFSAKSSER